MALRLSPRDRKSEILTVSTATGDLLTLLPLSLVLLNPTRCRSPQDTTRIRYGPCASESFFIGNVRLSPLPNWHDDLFVPTRYKPTILENYAITLWK